jgi:hypothetical protein
LKRPLKFLIRLLSSFLPKTAIEVAVCSKYSLAVIVIASLQIRCLFTLSWYHQYRPQQLPTFLSTFASRFEPRYWPDR